MGKAIIIQKFLRTPVHGSGILDAKPGELLFISQKNVFSNCQSGQCACFLDDDGHPFAIGFNLISDGHDFPIYQKTPAVQFVNTCQQRAEGGFSRTVFSNQSTDFSPI